MPCLRKFVSCLLIFALAGSMASAAAHAVTGTSWDYVYGDPGPENYSRYQSVRLGADGSAYIGGFFSGTFQGLSSPAAYTRFLQRIRPDGTIAWTRPVPEPTGAAPFTNLPPAFDLAIDGVGTIYSRE